MSQKLIETLQRLSTSDIQLDQKAVERIEREYGENLPQIISDLGDYQIVQEVIYDNRVKSKKIIFVLEGLFWASLAAIFTSFIRPSVIPLTFTFSFIAGSTNKARLYLENKPQNIS